jgi:hypothetical protein
MAKIPAACRAGTSFTAVGVCSCPRNRGGFADDWFAAVESVAGEDDAAQKFLSYCFL